MREVAKRYAGKRFAAFLFTGMLLMAGLLYGKPESYSSFAAALGLAFSIYAGGQSATDWKKVHENANDSP